MQRRPCSLGVTPPKSPPQQGKSSCLLLAWTSPSASPSPSEPSPSGCPVAVLMAPVLELMLPGPAGWPSGAVSPYALLRPDTARGSQAAEHRQSLEVPGQGPGEKRKAPSFPGQAWRVFSPDSPKGRGKPRGAITAVLACHGVHRAAPALGAHAAPVVGWGGAERGAVGRGRAAFVVGGWS